MSDPFAPHSTDDLETSTAMTTVGDDAMDHVGGEAARLVKAAISTKPQRSTRKSKSFATVPVHDAAQASLIGRAATTATTGVEAFPETVAPKGDADRHAASVLDSTEDPMVETPLDTAAPDGDADAPAIEPTPEPSMTDFDSAPTNIEPPLEDVQAASVTVPAAATALPPSGAGSPSAEESDIMLELGSKVARTIQGNVDASLAFFMAMLNVKTPAEAIELNTTHFRRQMESFVSTYQDFSALAHKAVAASMSSLSHLR